MKRIVTLVAAALLLAAPAFGQDTPKMDKKNLVVKEWNMDAKSKVRYLDHVTTYNAEGKKIEEIENTSSGQKWRKRFEYGADGRVSRELLYNERNKLSGYKKFEYNEFGKKKTQYTYDAKGKLLTIKTFEYLTEDA